MNNTQLFLSKYKELEGILREKGLDYKDTLETEDKQDSNKFTISRQMRNYLSHNEDQSFITPSEKQIKLLDKTIKEFKTSEDLVKKHMKKIDLYTVSLSDKCEIALEKLIKLKKTKIPVYSVIRGKEQYGVVSIFDLTEGLIKSKTNKVSDVKINSTEGKDFIKISTETSYKDIDENKIYFVYNEKEKCTKGVIF